MTSAFISRVKKMLEAERNTLTERLNALATKSNRRGRPLATQWEDLGEKEDENAAEVATYQDNLSLEQNLEQSLEDVRLALTAIDAGTYGICTKCGKAIEQARLEILPTAKFCLEHKSEGH